MRYLYRQVTVALILIATRLAGAQTVDKPLTIGNGVLAPKLTQQVDPDFPRPLFSKQKGGEVLVYLVVDNEGLPQRIAVDKSTNPKLNEAALKAVRQYRFEPATREGKSVSVELRMAVQFQVFVK